MARQSLDRLIDDLGAVRADPTSTASTELLRKGLAAPANVVVAKAARLVREHRLAGFEAALTEAFFRFMQKPSSLDRGCDATTSIAQSLLETDARSDEAARVYLAGVRHRQRDGPSGDSAAALRGYCGLGLLNVGHRDALVILTDLLADPEPPARVAAARGLGSTGRDEAALVLRLKLRIGDRSPDVLAECMTGALKCDPARSVDLVAGFFDSEIPDAAEIAALALGESRLPAALRPLRDAFDRARDMALRRAILLGAAVLRRPEAIDWLLSVVANGVTPDAVGAVEALKLYRGDANVEPRVRAAVVARNASAVTAAMEKVWGK